MIKFAVIIIIGGILGALMGHYGKCTSGSCPLTANPYRGAIYGILMATLLVFALSKTDSSKLPSNKRKENSMVLQLEKEVDFKNQVLESSDVCLVDFFSHSCPPCRMLEPTIKQLGQEYDGKAKIIQVNLDQVPELARQFGINAIPAVIFFKNGKEVQRIVGLRSKAEYSQLLDSLIDTDGQ